MKKILSVCALTSLAFFGLAFAQGLEVEGFDDLPSEEETIMPETETPVVEEEEIVTEESQVENENADQIESFQESAPEEGMPRMQIDFSVANISRNNEDAEKVGAQPGDVLRYKLKISGDDPIMEFEPQIDIKHLLSISELKDIGLGVVDGDILLYPSVTATPPWNNEYTFFARINKDCGGKKSVDVSFGREKLLVNLNCGLSKSGPTGIFVGVVVLIVLVGAILMGRRQSM